MCHTDPGDSSLIIDLLRDAVELKKLNGGLMKPALFEDLVADTYAVLYQNNLSKFVEQATEEESRERMKVDHLLMASDGGEGARTPTQAPGPKPRSKGVLKKELQRKADAVATKSLAPRPAAKPTRQEEEPQHQPPPPPIVEVTVPARPSAFSRGEEKDENKDEAKDEVSGIQSSAPGSLHDSADDESELSEVDEDKVAEPPGDDNDQKKNKSSLSLMFPNLLRNAFSRHFPGSDQSTANVSSVDDVDTGPATSTQDIKSDPIGSRPSEPEVD